MRVIKVFYELQIEDCERGDSMKSKVQCLKNLMLFKMLMAKKLYLCSRKRKNYYKQWQHLKNWACATTCCALLN